ncbi:MAG: ABC transporter ATP-binding protein [Eubacteriales bacterium]
MTNQNKEKKFKSPGEWSKSSIILRVLAYLPRHKADLALAILLTISSNVLALVAPALSGKAIAAIVGPGQVDFPTVLKYAIWMVICYLASALLSFFLSAVMINLGQKVVYTMRKQVFEHLVDLPVGYFDKNQTGDLISRLSYDIDTINASLSNDLLQICSGVITVVGSAIMMVKIAPPLMLVFAVTVPILVLFTIYRVRKVKPLFRARSAKLGELNGYVEEMLSGQKTIRAYAQEKVMIEKFDVHNDDAIEAYFRADYQGSVVGPSVNFINNVSLSLISMFGALLFLFGRIEIDGLSTFILYSRKFSGPINETANIISEIQSATSAARRIFTLLDQKVEPKPKEDDRIVTGQSGRVELSDVSFSYTPDRPVLTHLSVTIPKGSKIAIVGPTGSGKTTVINLLMRFYDIDTGEIRIDGVNTSHATLDSVRSCFSMVLQETWLFEGTIAENIAYSNPDATREQIEAAAKAAKIHDYILSLPKGYDTVLDENGVNISKGQKQLLTIARAMLSPSPILILDEATSNVDSRTESLLQSAMDALSVERTSIIVAHRLSTIQNADCILVIKDGKLIESGKHEELLASGGFYASLYNSQFEVTPERKDA